MKSAEKNRKTLADFVNILANIKEIRKARKECLNSIFWEFNNCNIDQFEDIESKIKKYISEKITYPRSFLASNIGFNRSTMEPRFSDILNKFKLDKRSTSGSIRNALHFDVLKHLILKHFDGSRK
jgi:hypothetical protein